MLSHTCAHTLRTERLHSQELTVGEISMCPEDGGIVIRNSELISGRLDKSVVGESKKTIFYRMLRDFGEDEAADAMRRLSKLTTTFLSSQGFSIGIDDVTPSEQLSSAKRDTISRGYGLCDGYIQASTNTAVHNMARHGTA